MPFGPRSPSPAPAIDRLSDDRTLWRRREDCQPLSAAIPPIEDRLAIANTHEVDKTLAAPDWAGRRRRRSPLSSANAPPARRQPANLIPFCWSGSRDANSQIPTASFEIERVVGGQSNPTYFVTLGAAGWRFARNRPARRCPHPMRRIGSIAFCRLSPRRTSPCRRRSFCRDDVSVVGTPFYLMERLDGWGAELGKPRHPRARRLCRVPFRQPAND